MFGNMAGNIIDDMDKIYGERIQSDNREQREMRRKDVINNLSSTIKGHDNILAKVKVK